METFILFVGMSIFSWKTAAEIGASSSGLLIVALSTLPGAIFFGLALLFQRGKISSLKRAEEDALNEVIAKSARYESQFGQLPEVPQEIPESATHQAHQAHTLGHLVGGETGGWVGAGAVFGAHLAVHAAKGVKRFLATTAEQRKLENEINQHAREAKLASEDVSTMVLLRRIGALIVIAQFIVAGNL